MSLMVIKWASLAVLGMSGLVEGLETTRVEPNDDPTWNYTNHGTDWDFADCNDSSYY